MPRKAPRPKPPLGPDVQGLSQVDAEVKRALWPLIYYTRMLGDGTIHRQRRRVLRHNRMRSTCGGLTLLNWKVGALSPQQQWGDKI